MKLIQVTTDGPQGGNHNKKGIVGVIGDNIQVEYETQKVAKYHFVTRNYYEFEIYDKTNTTTLIGTGVGLETSYDDFSDGLDIVLINYSPIGLPNSNIIVDDNYHTSGTDGTLSNFYHDINNTHVLVAKSKITRKYQKQEYEIDDLL